MRAAHSLSGLQLQQLRFDLNVDPQVDPNLTDGVAQIRKRTVRVAAAVADDDIMAAPQHHLVEAQVFEMASVREIDIGIGGIRQPECLCQHRPDRDARAGTVERIATRRSPDFPATTRAAH